MIRVQAWQLGAHVAGVAQSSAMRPRALVAVADVLDAIARVRASAIDDESAFALLALELGEVGRYDSH